MLFRVEENPSCPAEGRLLGYQWIEVLAIEPRAIANKGRGYGTWCHKLLANWYVCRTECGLIRIPDADFWAAIEEHEEYRISADTSRFPTDRSCIVKKPKLPMATVRAAVGMRKRNKK